MASRSRRQYLSFCQLYIENLLSLGYLFHPKLEQGDKAPDSIPCRPCHFESITSGGEQLGEPSPLTRRALYNIEI